MNSLTSTVFRDDRQYYFILLGLLAIVAAIKNRSLKYLAIIFPMVLVYYFVDDLRASRPMPSPLFFTLFILSICWMLFVLRKLKIYTDPRQRKFVELIIVFAYLFMCFSAMNFFTPRYMLASVVPVLFFAGVVFDRFIERTYPVLFYPVLLVICGISVYTYANCTNYGDAEVGAFQGLEVQQKVVDYFEKNDLYDKNIGLGSFLECQHLINPASGFLKSDKAFTKVRWEIDGSTEYAIFDGIEQDARYETIKKDTAFERVFRVQKGLVWAEIYKRR